MTENKIIWKDNYLKKYFSLGIIFFMGIIVLGSILNPGSNIEQGIIGVLAISVFFFFFITITSKKKYKRNNFEFLKHIIFYVVFPLMLILIINSSVINIIMWYVGLLIIFALLFYGMIWIFKKKQPLITNEGILLGNFSHGKREVKVRFFRWSEIKNIQIRNFITAGALFYMKDTYLILKLKKGDMQDCLIGNPKGFIETLKKLKKERLISKDSKFR